MTIVVIDPATNGIASLYLEAYLRDETRENIVAIGAYGARSDKIKKFFFKFTDLAPHGKQRFGMLRLPLRYLESFYGLSRTFVELVKIRPKAILYALSSNLFVEMLFILICRIAFRNITIVCHDVVPFTQIYESHKFKSFQRSIFYRLAKTLIVHNTRSIEELNKGYNIRKDKIKYLPFPIMDLSNLNNEVASESTGSVNCLFIGHLRREKGVDLLIDAWKSCSQRIPFSHLTIAGTIPVGVDLGDVSSLSNLTLKAEYISDDEFVRLIHNADVVIFPYRAGTNSGVLSNVVSLGKPVIVSDIDMFVQSGLVSEGSYFQTGNAEALAAKIIEFSDLSDEERSARTMRVEATADKRTMEFTESLDKLLHQL